MARRILALLASPILHLSGEGSRTAVIGWWAVVLAVVVAVVLVGAAVTGHLLIGLVVAAAVLASVVPVLKREWQRRGALAR